MSNPSITKQRLSEFAYAIGKNKRQFTKDIGVSESFLVSKGGITEEKIINIISIFPQLNANWLLTGKGSMLLPESENLSENKSNLAKQSKEEERNSSIDGLINEKIEKVVMENLDKTIATIMKGMNKNNEQQNAHVEKILKIQSEENSRNFNTLIDAVREIVREEDREKFDRKIVQLKTKLG